MKFKKNGLRLSLGLLSLMVSMFSYNVHAAATIAQQFPENEGFARCIASALNREITDTITQADIEGITLLKCPGQGLTSIQDIPQLTKLQEADFSNNQIVNVGVFGFLNEVHTINLSGNNTIIDLQALIFTDDLRNLDVSNTRLANLPILGEFIYLQSLNLANNNLDSIAFVSNLNQLRSLDVSDNHLPSLLAIQGLSSLQTVEARNNNFTNIDVLPPNVRNLDLSNNQINNIMPLRDFSSLNWLDVKNNQLSNIDFLTDQHSLTYVDVSGNPITSVLPLNTMGDLSVFTADYDKLEDVDALNEPNRSIVLRNQPSSTEPTEQPSVDQEGNSFIDNALERVTYWFNRGKNFLQENVMHSAIAIGLLLLIMLFTLIGRRRKSKHDWHSDGSSKMVDDVEKNYITDHDKDIFSYAKEEPEEPEVKYTTEFLHPALMDDKKPVAKEEEPQALLDEENKEEAELEVQSNNEEEALEGQASNEEALLQDHVHDVEQESVVEDPIVEEVEQEQALEEEPIIEEQAKVESPVEEETNNQDYDFESLFDFDQEKKVEDGLKEDIETTSIPETNRNSKVFDHQQTQELKSNLESQIDNTEKTIANELDEKTSELKDVFESLKFDKKEDSSEN